MAFDVFDARRYNLADALGSDADLFDDENSAVGVENGNPNPKPVIPDAEKSNQPKPVADTGSADNRISEKTSSLTGTGAVPLNLFGDIKLENDRQGMILRCAYMFIFFEFFREKRTRCASSRCRRQVRGRNSLGSEGS